MPSDQLIQICTTKMKKAFEIFCQELSSLRTGRSNASMLDIIKVDVYGQMMPINQLATISTPDPRSINVQVWDQNNVNLIDSAIKKSNLGINPQIDGQLLRLPIPSLNEERRSELKKIMGGLAEKAKQAFGIDAVNDFDPLFEDIYDYCEVQKIDIDTLSHEAGAAQMILPENKRKKIIGVKEISYKINFNRFPIWRENFFGGVLLHLP